MLFSLARKKNIIIKASTSIQPECCSPCPFSSTEHLPEVRICSTKMTQPRHTQVFNVHALHFILTTLRKAEKHYKIPYTEETDVWVESPEGSQKIF